ncbi:MAG: Tad domain-containing protein, partial [Pseudomonadota bacterium]
MHQDSQKSFLKDESGALVLFVLALLLFTMLFAGMAVDYIRHENARADLQNALDRGILAATNVKRAV